MEILIGCDPELFLTNKEGNFRSAWGLIPGTKEEPYKVDKGAVQVDGLALEFNTDPARTADEFVGNIKTVMGELRKMVPDDYDFAIVPSCRFNGNHFRAQPDEAKELGCTPDFDAYTLAETPKPNNNTTMRTASGHVHIGFCEGADPGDPMHMQRCAALVKQLDWYLGLPSLFWDRDKQRRTMYGKAGCFRAKPYGVEYRTLSNAWLLDENRQRFVFDMAKLAVDDLIAGVRPFEGRYGPQAANYINRSFSTYDAGTLMRSNDWPRGQEILGRVIAL